MTQQKNSATEANDRIYKKELFVVVASALVCMIVAMGMLFMLPFPGLLEVYIWGFPFPYWYQMTVAYIGVIAFIYWIVNIMTRLDEQKAKAQKEV